MTKLPQIMDEQSSAVPVVICGMVGWEITGFEAQVLTYLIMVTGMSEIKDTVAHQFNLVRDHTYTILLLLLFYSYHRFCCLLHVLSVMNEPCGVLQR